MKFYNLLLVLIFFVGCSEKEPKVIYDSCLIDNEEVFIDIAEKILFNEYGKENIKQQQPYIVSLINDSIWVLRGKSTTTLGGEFYLEMNCKDARIIKIEHTK